MFQLGIIGSGERAAWIARCLCAQDAGVSIAVVADPDPDSARSRLRSAKVPHDHSRFVPDADEMLEYTDQLDGIIIGTRCDLHAPMAVKVADAGLPVFLEKPVAITTEQLRLLHHAYQGREESVVVSFPLRMTPLFQEVLRIVRCGRLGTINQIQAVNYVPYGGVYFSQWYRDFETNGGLWLQKATHDFDCLNQLVGAAPASVVATSSRMVYGGEMPDELHCSACAVSAKCPESPAGVAARGDDGGVGYGDHACVFSSSIHHHDAGSALIMYEGGTHAAYSQNFISRRSSAARGTRITGYLATLTYDWCADSIRIIEHHGKSVENIRVKVPEGHHGGDAALARNFLDVMRGEDVSRSPLDAGVLSCAVCRAARASETSRRFEPVLDGQGLGLAADRTNGRPRLFLNMPLISRETEGHLMEDT